MNTNPWVLFVRAGGEAGRKKEEGVGVEARSEHHSGPHVHIPAWEGVEVEQGAQVRRKTMVSRPKT